MNETVKAYVKEKVNEMIQAPSCCAEAKAAGQAWLDALGTEQEAEKTKELIAELEEDIMSIDGLIAFAGSDLAVRLFGKEGAEGMLAHAKERKASGEKYCDCAACAAVEAILKKKQELL